MHTCTQSTRQVQNPATDLTAGAEGPPAAAGRAMSRRDAVWLAGMQLWAGAVLLTFGVRNEHIRDLVLEAFARVKADWPLFVAPRELAPETARRRWVAQVLLQHGASHLRAQSVEMESRAAPYPSALRALYLDEARAGAVAPGLHDQAAPSAAHGVVTACEPLRWLESKTTPRRWRMWLAYHIDGVHSQEVARQERCSRAHFVRELELARNDLQLACAREVACGGRFRRSEPRGAST